jgi:hypothetical protein
MRRQIVRLSVGQTSKVLAAVYGLMGLVLLPFLLLASRGADRELGVGFALAMPVIYALLGYVCVAIGRVVYNFVARHIGGIEAEVEGPRDGTP